MADVDPALLADIESSFDAIGPFEEVRGNDLPLFVEGMESLLDALSPPEEYVRLYKVRQTWTRGMPNDQVRAWLTDAKKVCQTAMRAGGITHTVVWAYHEGPGGFKQWQLWADDRPVDTVL